MKTYFIDQMEKNISIYKDHNIIVDGNKTISFFEIKRRAYGIANNISARGIGVGDCVGVTMSKGNSPEYIAVLWGLSLVGCIIFPVSILRSQEQILKALEAVPIKLVITSPDVLEFEYPGVVLFDDIDGIDDELTFEQPEFSDEDSVLCFQTSGTTDSPKTYIHSRKQFEHTLNQYKILNNWQSSDRFFHTIPAFDSIGCYHTFAALNSATTLVIPSEDIKTIGKFISHIRSQRISLLQVMPWQIRMMLRYLSSWRGSLRYANVFLGGRLFPNLKAIYVSTEPFPSHEKAAAKRRLTENVYEGYGCSELWFIAKETKESINRYPGSVGKVVDSLEMEVVNEEDRKLPAGEVGRIRFRTDYMAQSYVNNSGATKNHFKDGWFYLGDEGFVNEEGYLFLNGRYDDAITVNGATYYPSEVESVLYSHKRVKEVAVFAWPTTNGDGSAAAVIKREKHLDADDLLVFLKKNLVKYKVPGMLIFMDQLPKTRTGKVAKAEIKEQLKAENVYVCR